MKNLWASRDENREYVYFWRKKPSFVNGEWGSNELKECAGSIKAALFTALTGWETIPGEQGCYQIFIRDNESAKISLWKTPIPVSAEDRLADLEQEMCHFRQAFESHARSTLKHGRRS